MIERSPPQAGLDPGTVRSAGKRLTHGGFYQGDVRMVMKGCVQWNLVYGWKDFRGKRDLHLGQLVQCASA